MKIVGVIPARYQSSRFPGKPLVDLNGVPMIIRVAKIVEKTLGKENTYVATDDDKRRAKMTEDFLEKGKLFEKTWKKFDNSFKNR